MLPLRHLRAGLMRPGLRGAGPALGAPRRVVPSVATRPGVSLRARWASTDTESAPPKKEDSGDTKESASAGSDSTPSEDEPVIPDRLHGSFYISNVFPIMLGAWDVRPMLARLREETLMEQLAEILGELKGRHAFKVESWEVNRKDGGVFCHFSYLPPNPAELAKVADNTIHTPEDDIPEVTSPASLFIPRLLEAAKKKGGWPSWAGPWWAACIDRHTQGGRVTDEAGHHLYQGNLAPLPKTDEPQLQGWQRVAGAGRVWIVRGRQWTEDLNRFPSARLRVEFDGPDVSQEMLYRLFRPYGRLREINPPTPVPAGALRFAILSFSRISTTVVANNCLHGYLSPVKTSDYDARLADDETSIPTSRLRLYYERPLKAHYVRQWMSDHPRIVLPVVAFLIATLSYTFFDPIRAFFVRSQVEGVWNLEQYSVVRYIKEQVYAPIESFLGRRLNKRRRRSVDDLGRASWRDRVEAERNIERWLSEYPSTFIVVTGPPGSGKQDLIARVIRQEKKPALLIDCAELQRAKTDSALVGAVADQTGYWPTFSFMQSMNGLIDLAATGLIGQKAGFSTPIDQQLRNMFDIVSTALKDVSAHGQELRKKAHEHARDEVLIAAAEAREMEQIKLGIWHDGRMDCVAGNGIMSELGLGIEEPTEYDIPAPPAPVMGSNAPIEGEGVPPTTSVDAFDSVARAALGTGDENPEDDVEASVIQTLPIVVLRNFAVKPARGDLWSVLSEWGASLVENKIAHVIVIGEGSVTTKALTQALPSKPLNTVVLSDADDSNSLEFVREKLSTPDTPVDLSEVDKENIAKLGGRMVDLELLVYKVRSGQTITHAVDDIVRRNVVELRKAAFGDDSEDAKHLPWTRPQAWKIVTELAKKPEASYAKLLLDFPFKGAEGALKALEEHDLIRVEYVDGRASRVRPGKPVFRQAFASLVNDSVFHAVSQIEYSTAVKAKAESSIATLEDELTKLRQITGDEDKLGVGDRGWWGFTRGSAIHQRAQYLVSQIADAMEKLYKADAEIAAQKKVFADKPK